MIIRFKLENWMSFRGRSTFSMIASRERQHGKRVAVLGKYGTRILPVAAIYGGNASGKSNLFKALRFARNLVVEGTRLDGLIPVEPFQLDPGMSKQPTQLSFELLINEIIYEFSFAVTRQKVVEEKLVRITSTTEKLLYHRHDEDIDFGASLVGDRQFLEFAFRGTRDNQLFLNNTVSQKVSTFQPIYDWFKDKLVLIAPDAVFAAFEHLIDEKHRLYSDVNEALSRFDTGITHLDGEDIPFEKIPLPEPLKSDLQEEIEENMLARIRTDSGERFVVTRQEGELNAKKLIACHSRSDGTEAWFDTRQESDGTQRMIELLPTFLIPHDAERVIFIDEVDRSLHTLLTRHLLEMYLAKCSAKTRTQLLFTTHDLLLMDQHLLRRDEMWVTERDATGNTSLFSFSDYADIRYDKDIRKSYLQGRLGGIPRILSEECIDSSQYSVADE